MDDSSTALAAAVLGVVLGALSLGWQAATYVLTGGRIKVSLRVGAMGPGGMVTTKPADLSPGWLEPLAEQGYGRPVVSVRVANVGRQPVTVARWGLKSRAGASLYPMADSIGPPLPHRLDTGESASWAVDMAQVHAFAVTVAETLTEKPAPPNSPSGAFAAGWRSGQGDGIAGVVELADGRTKYSPETIR
jgi:hypothetical protein